jgi:hypothetical protein
VIGRKRDGENGRWTTFERLDVVVDSARHIWAVDTDGDANGALRANGTLEMVYQEPGTSDAAAAIVHLKRTRGQLPEPGCARREAHASTQSDRPKATGAVRKGPTGEPWVPPC